MMDTRMKTRRRLQAVDGDTGVASTCTRRLTEAENIVSRLSRLALICRTI